METTPDRYCSVPLADALSWYNLAVGMNYEAISGQNKYKMRLKCVCDVDV